MANITTEMVPIIIKTGAMFRAEVKEEPRFAVGESVRAVNLHPSGYTRLPRYIRGKVGVIEQQLGGFVFADKIGQGIGEDPEHLYSIRFSAVELWGPGASPNDSVCITLWDSHLAKLEGAV
ncbi:SH3-like domain-containing protein [Hoeflea sp. Naph1]|uniref:SH3-like domain-containing protein n=1 Tax=Hoeflea sp. Naph1 TaxID=3388653 RepID=UPI00398FCFC7